MRIGANLGFVGPDLLVGHSSPLELRDQPLDRRPLLARHQIGREVERRLPEQLVDDLPVHGLALFRFDLALQRFANGLAQFRPDSRSRSNQKTRRSAREGAAVSGR